MVLKVDRFQKRAFLLTVHGVRPNWRQYRCIYRIDKTKKTKWYLVPKILFWLKFFVKKRLQQLMNNHTASLEVTVNVHKSVLSRKLMFWSTNWKHAIKYDLYIKHPRIFARNVQICAKFSCKNFTGVCPVFWLLCHYTWGPFFRGHTVYYKPYPR